MYYFNYPLTIIPCSASSKKQDATASSHIQHLSVKVAQTAQHCPTSFPWSSPATLSLKLSGFHLVTWKLHVALVRALVTYWKWIKTKLPKTLTAFYSGPSMVLRSRRYGIEVCSCAMLVLQVQLDTKLPTDWQRGAFHQSVRYPLCHVENRTPKPLLALQVTYQVCKRCKKWKKKTHLASSMSIWWYRKAYSQK